MEVKGKLKLLWTMHGLLHQTNLFSTHQSDMFCTHQSDLLFCTHQSDLICTHQSHLFSRGVLFCVGLGGGRAWSVWQGEGTGGGAVFVQHLGKSSSDVGITVLPGNQKQNDLRVLPTVAGKLCTRSTA